MALKRNNENRWYAPVLSILLIAILCSCGSGGVEMAWSEEVRLPGGALIVVERTASGERRGEIGGPDRWEPKAMVLRIPALDASTPSPPEWRSQYVPILLDYDAPSATWSVVATFAYCQTWQELGRPSSPYLEFQSRAGAAWERVDLETSRLGQDTNLLAAIRATGEPTLVQESDKKWRRSRTAPSYRKIVKKWINNC